MSAELIHCSLCRGDFPRAAKSVVPGCDFCTRNQKDPGSPRHYSFDEHCRSGGARRHEGCRGRSHCTCDRCF
jgi:hypothetical protein